MHKLKGIYGIAYSCSQKDNKYCDDWFTNNYKNIYNSTNNRSLCHVRSLGFNNIRTYYLDPEKTILIFYLHVTIIIYLLKLEYQIIY